MPRPSPFRYPEIFRLGELLYASYPRLLRNVEDLLHERGIDICRENGAVLVAQVRTEAAKVRSKSASEFWSYIIQ